MITTYWPHPAVIARNNFKYKSLSCWSYNIAIGCEHACQFCYVPDASTNRMAGKLKEFGVKDPDAEWGDYVLLRQWDEKAFVRSLIEAQNIPDAELNKDGNRAVMLCTTTDPYQVLGNRELQNARSYLVRRALGMLQESSQLNVRILTRSPLAREDFYLMKKFGKRLLFGMSIPTLNNRLAKIYEPKAPAPTQRLETLKAAKAAGLNVYVAVAPVYPECGPEDMNATLRAIRDLGPVTIFMEPINIRAENVQRITDHCKTLGIEWKGAPFFSSPETWRAYAVKQLLQFQQIATSLDIGPNVLHLWPDKSLGSKDSTKQAARLFVTAENYTAWLQHSWNKVSAWPQ